MRRRASVAVVDVIARSVRSAYSARRARKDATWAAVRGRTTEDDGKNDFKNDIRSGEKA